MKSTDRMILLAVVAVGLAAAFWFLLLSPKRAELSELDRDVAALEASVAEQEQLAATAEQAEAEYRSNYQRLIVLGKAVPGDDDAASLVVQTSSLARQAGIDFRSLTLAEGGGEAPPPPPAAETTADGAEAETAATPAAPATEASAANLPIGATVGPAGLPVMPYDVKFRGDFFEIADFLASLDKMVDPGRVNPGVNGRLVTVDGFALTPDPEKGFPHLAADLHVTTYVAPADQGLTGGATPTTPPAAIPAEPVPVSSP